MISPALQRLMMGLPSTHYLYNVYSQGRVFNRRGFGTALACPVVESRSTRSSTTGHIFEGG
jgi:hypothetical protein